MSQEQNRTEEPILYDADAAQTIPLEITRGGRRYPTRHAIGPCPDDLYVEYDKQRNPRVRVGRDKTVESLDDAEKATSFLYREVLESVTGWGDPRGANVDERVARMVIEGGLLICAVDEDEEAPEVGDAEEDRPWEQTDKGEGAVRLRCRFNGRELVTRHFPQAAPSAEQRKRYNGLNAKKKLAPGGSLSQSTVALASIARPLGKLYDELFGRAEGYAGRVPLWHKGEVVTHYMDRDEVRVGEG